MSAATRLGCDSPGQSQTWHFPSGFLWGAATSSHQVEGGNRWNDWWEYEQSGQLPYRSGDACRHYELYDQDFDMARSWDHNAHRFSIEWSRIEPSEGKWNPDAVDHYRAVIRALKQRGLEPVVTLHHFTNPAWFARGGGWLRQDSATAFARYVAYVIEHLGKEVKYWLTINEPTVYAMQAYIRGEWPPCLKVSWIKAIRVLRNLAKAHVASYRVLHKYRHDVLVGFAHSALLIVPCNPERRRDRMATDIRDIFWNRAFFHLIGAKAPNAGSSQCLDFIGINYYTRSIIRSVGWGAGAFLGRVCRLSHHSERGPMNDIGWEVYPPGLQIVLERFSRFGIPLLVTENGVATNDEDLRRNFLIQHLVNLAKALDRGIKVIGYLYWTLIDNYEWAMGTAPHFGLAAVDHATQERRPRPCVEDFSRVCRENRVSAHSTDYAC
jgi:beta-glucosidase